MALLEGTAGSGQELVAPEYIKRVLEKFTEYGLARRLFAGAMYETQSYVAYAPKVDRSGISVEQASEYTTVGTTNASTSYVQISLSKFGKGYPISSEMMDDAIIDVTRMAIDQLTWAMAKMEDDLVFTGDTGSGDAFDGLIKGAGETIDLDVNYLTPDDISKAIAILTQNGARREDLVLVVHPMTEHYLRILKDNNGNYLFNTIQAGDPILQTGAVGRVMGIPIYVTDVLDSANESNGDSTKTALCTDALMFDRRNAAVFVTKRGEPKILVDNEPEKDGKTLYLWNHVGFKVIYDDLIVHFDKVQIDDTA